MIVFFSVYVYLVYCLIIYQCTVKQVVFQYKNIPDNNWGKELLLHDLPIEWSMPEPEAVISITGIEHQFNIKDNSKLKRDLIEAVISTGKLFYLNKRFFISFSTSYVNSLA